MKSYEDLVKHLKSKDKEKPVPEEIIEKRQERMKEMDPKAKAIVESAQPKRKIILKKRKDDGVQSE